MDGRQIYLYIIWTDILVWGLANKLVYQELNANMIDFLKTANQIYACIVYHSGIYIHVSHNIFHKSVSVSGMQCL